MNTRMMRWANAALLCAGIGLAPTSGATQFSTNFSDLWWVPSELGWGANISQQSDTMFMTMFVYGPSGQPIWYIATLDYQIAAPDGSLVWSGDLLQTAGAWFGAPWSPALFSSRKVGTATFRAASVAQATLTYAVDGIVVTKQIERQPLRNNDNSGSYYGGTTDVSHNCINPLLNNVRTEDQGSLSITQTGPLISIKAPTCTFAGTYSQEGQIGRADTTYLCTNGAVGSVTFFDMHVETSGILGRYTGRDPICQFDGNIGGYRKQ
jgi:hypothetical protein